MNNIIHSLLNHLRRKNDSVLISGLRPPIAQNKTTYAKASVGECGGAPIQSGCPNILWR